MPAMPIRLPRRAVVGDDSPRNARMKQTAATRYPSATRLALMAVSSTAPLEHLEHALGDGEAAEDVDPGKHDGEEADHG